MEQEKLEGQIEGRIKPQTGTPISIEGRIGIVQETEYNLVLEMLDTGARDVYASDTPYTEVLPTQFYSCIKALNKRYVENLRDLRNEDKRIIEGLEKIICKDEDLIYALRDEMKSIVRGKDYKTHWTL